MKNLCNVFCIDGELCSSYPTFQLYTGILSIWVELFYQFINRVLKVPKQISPIFCFKYPRDKCSSQGIKFNYSFHYSRSFHKNVGMCLWIERSYESFTSWVLRWMASPFQNRRWWNISHRLFSLRGTSRHLQKNIHTTKNQVQKHNTQTSTWLDPN